MGNHIVHAVLDEENLTLMRASMAKTKAIEVNPRLFSAMEIEQAYLREFQITGSFWKKYAIPPDAAAMISHISGAIIVHQV